MSDRAEPHDEYDLDCKCKECETCDEYDEYDEYGEYDECGEYDMLDTHNVLEIFLRNARRSRTSEADEFPLISQEENE